MLPVIWSPEQRLFAVAIANLVSLALEQGERRRVEESLRASEEEYRDFFEDALKPLPVQIRQKCQELAQRRAQFIVNFLRQAVPQKPGLGDEAITLSAQESQPPL